MHGLLNVLLIILLEILTKLDESDLVGKSIHESSTQRGFPRTGTTGNTYEDWFHKREYTLKQFTGATQLQGPTRLRFLDKFFKLFNIQSCSEKTNVIKIVIF